MTCHDLLSACTLFTLVLQGPVVRPYTTVMTRGERIAAPRTEIPIRRTTAAEYRAHLLEIRRTLESVCAAA